MSVFRFSQMLEIDKRILLHALVQRSQIRRAEPERVLSNKVVEVPVDKLPIESVVVGNEHVATITIGFEPVLEFLHNDFGFFERHALFARESTHS